MGENCGGDKRTPVQLASLLRMSNKALADLGRLVVRDDILQGALFDHDAGQRSFVDLACTIAEAAR